MTRSTAPVHPHRRRRLARATIAPVGIALGLAFAPIPAIGDEAVQTRAALVNGGGRLIFDWPAPVDFVTTVSATRLTISFDRPLAATFGDVLGTLSAQVGDIRIADSGQSVVVTLLSPQHVTAFAQDDLVVVDMLPVPGARPAAPQTPDVAVAPQPDPASPPATVTPPVDLEPASGTSAAPTVAAAPDDFVPPAPVIVNGILSVRYGLHDAYDRIVFDWPERVPYTVRNDNGLIHIRFEAAAEIDAERLESRLPARLRLVAVDTGTGTLELTLAAPAGVRVRDFYNYSKTVVDIYRDPNNTVPVSVAGDPVVAQSAAEDVPESTEAAPTEIAVADPPPAPPFAPEERIDAPAPDVATTPEPEPEPDPPAVAMESDQDQAESPSAVDALSSLPETADDHEAPATADAAVMDHDATQDDDSDHPMQVADAGQQAEPESAAAATHAEADDATDGDTAPTRSAALDVVPADPHEAEVHTDAPTQAHTDRGEIDLDHAAVDDHGPDAPAADTPDAAMLPDEDPDAPDVVGHADEDGMVGDDMAHDTASAEVEGAIAATVEVVVIGGDTDALMRLRWSQPVRAAVVKRGDRIWVAFDRAAENLDFSVVESEAGTLYDEPKLSESENALVFSLRVDDQIEPRVSAAGDTWFVQLRPRRSETTTELTPERFEDPVLGPAIAYPVVDPGEPLVIDDPEVGDQFVMVPIATPGEGLQQGARFVQFNAMPSAQGLVFDRLSDDVVVRRHDDRIEVVAGGGLTLSDDQAWRDAMTADPPVDHAALADPDTGHVGPDHGESAHSASPAGSHDAPMVADDDHGPADPAHASSDHPVDAHDDAHASGSADVGTHAAEGHADDPHGQQHQTANAPRGGAVGDFRLFEPEVWRMSHDGRFAAVSRQLQVEAANARTDGTRAEARARFARFLFGYGQYRDAAGILRLISADTPQRFVDDASLLALRGANALMNDEPADAVSDLSDPRLAPSAEAQYWLAAALSTAGIHDRAETLFQTAAEEPDWYTHDLRVPLALASIDTALAMDNLDRALEVLDDLPYFGLEPVHSAQIGLRRAAALWRSGEHEAAEHEWDDVEASPFEGLVAQAVFQRTNALYEAGQISADEAAAALDGVRYDWRGGAFELGLLRQLAEYQFDSGDYRSGFRTLQRAWAVFVDTPERTLIDQRMREMFAALFSADPPVNISPVTAIALYSEFDELVPEGEAGEAMRRRLAGQLVSVDLRADAAAVLRTLLHPELTGPARAELGRDLAVLYLADDQPESAMEILLNTRARGLGQDLLAERRLLRASAGLAQEAFADALDEIAMVDGRQADMLRAEINWRLGDWNGAAEAFGRLVEAGEFAWPPVPERAQPPGLDASADLNETGDDMMTGDMAMEQMLPSAEEAAALDAVETPDPMEPNDMASVEPRFSARTEPLDDFAAEQVLNWAMALTYSNDRDGLAYLRQRYSDSMAATELNAMFRLLVADEISPIDSVADLGRIGSNIDLFEQFLVGYRDRLEQELINTQDPLMEQEPLAEDSADTDPQVAAG